MKPITTRSLALVFAAGSLIGDAAEPTKIHSLAGAPEATPLLGALIILNSGRIKPRSGCILLPA